MKKIIILLITALTMQSCYMTEFGKYKDPDGSVILSVDDTNDTFANDDSYTINIGGKEYIITDGSMNNTLSLSEGSYTAHVYNTPADYTFTKNTFTKNTDLENIIVTLPTTGNGEIPSNPADLYYGSDTVTVENGKSTNITVTTQPMTRTLNLNLDREGDSSNEIENVTITINGIASGWNCTGNTPYGDAATVTISEVNFSDGSINSILNLLGTVPTEDQILTVDVSFKDNNPAPVSISSNLSEALKDFNSDKSTIQDIASTITLPNETNMNGSIGDWETTEEDVTIN